MATASLGKVVVYKPSAGRSAVGNRVDTKNSHAAIITKIESGNTVSLAVFLDQSPPIFVQGVTNDDSLATAHSWSYPV